jgi:ABC-type lipoprotein release transport system permease subunit
MNLLRMAWRNVWRNRRRTLATVGATALALFAMIVYSALVNGWIDGIKRKVLDYELGDIQVFAPDYRKSPSLYASIEDPAPLLSRLDAAGYAASARLLGSGLAAAGDQSAGVALRAVDPERDRTVSKVDLQVEAGQWLEASDPGGVVIGRRLARILGVDLGGEIVVLGQGADGSMANEVYTVRGVLGSIADGVDRGGVYMTTEAFRELMVFPAGAHQIIVRRPEHVALEDAGPAVREMAPGLDVQTWRELMPTLASMMDSSDAAMFMMFIIVYIAIGIVILNATLMAVFERVREFGVLKAIGVGPGGVLRLVLAESAIQTLLATVAGTVLALPMLHYLGTVGIDLRALGDMSVVGVAWDPVWKAKVGRGVFIGPIVTMVAVVTLAVIYPALKAALIKPVEAMRHR